MRRTTTTILVALVSAGCASTGAASVTRAVPARPEPRPSSTSATTRHTPTSGTAATTTTTTLPAEQPGWTTVSVGSSGVTVDEQARVLADGSHVTVARFRAGLTRFALHVGTQDPPTAGTTIAAGAGPAVSGTERSLLLAAFNGGFKVGSASGGVEVDGSILTPLTASTASFVIDTNGRGHVGVWGENLPAPGERIASVRQNLPPLVTSAHFSAQISDIAAWGARFKGENMVARSALGEDAHGNILYAGSMAALPSDVAAALIQAGATTAMELDINPEWVQLALAPHPGGPLSAGVSGQNRPADQYLFGWTRDFITVLATR